MHKYEYWSYNLDFIDKKTLKVEEEEGDLKMYSYFSTLRWKHCIAIVYKNIMLREYEDEDGSYYDEWNMAIDMLDVMKQEKEKKNKRKDLFL